MHLVLLFSPKVTCLLPHKKWHLLPVPLCRDAGGESPSQTHLQCGSARSRRVLDRRRGLAVWSVEVFLAHLLFLYSALLAAGQVSPVLAVRTPPAWTPSPMAAPGHCHCEVCTGHCSRKRDRAARCECWLLELDAWQAALCSKFCQEYVHGSIFVGMRGFSTPHPFHADRTFHSCSCLV